MDNDGEYGVTRLLSYPSMVMVPWGALSARQDANFVKVLSADGACAD